MATLRNIPKLFIGATRQHVGKTTVSLAMIAGLKKRVGKVGFIKPVGQQHEEVGQGLRVDKDVRLMKEYFKLDHCNYEDMSPVIIPKGYTKRFIDGEVSQVEQIRQVRYAYENMQKYSDCILIEGTGHTGVGSVVNLNNAQVAQLLGAEMVLVANGGLGSAFDELALNYSMCRDYGVNLRGVVLNKVLPDKVEMITDYFTKLLKQWNVPLLGVIPDYGFLGLPNLADFEKIFKTELISGSEFRERHYKVENTLLVATGLNVFMERLDHFIRENKRPLMVTHSTRSDIILGFLSYYQKKQIEGIDFEGALVLSGTEKKGHLPSNYIVDMMKTYRAPVLYSGVSTYECMDKIRGYTPKLHIGDKHRVAEAIDHYEPRIDFDALLDGLHHESSTASA
mmetsp:Transcript_5704/g.8636  ORF Transcript_5704/g.8636 Transcript_5704/m.8636 type:complete len:394 (-) Transcript_5704:135-1316(-)|eukprot:CAMPEP_0113948410 /NCGR_PEP_ID=MMETSP1339-20121228/70116_1 /TAXON_ID=94617 /ORGANISM="Fibrocapsa japonica" /LENGTH=393 /DNA_ID=CAMNT_0000955465 /DNA_START=54 /DNA_END=1235 /DNA_ORIENTATION=+ /assembly_acc=CAM_ASM_000762